MKLKIVIWGFGERSKYVVDSLLFDKCELIACIDKSKKQAQLIGGKDYQVCDIECIDDLSFDYLIVTVIDIAEIKEYIHIHNINESKVIYFWHEDISKYSFLSVYPKMYCLLENTTKKYEAQIKNIPYEYGTYTGPHIKPADELLELIIKEKKSLCRFGDGEFEIILGRDRAKFQKQSDFLSQKLLKAIQCEDSRIIIAIADNYGSLDKYTEDAAHAIRGYLTEDVRRQHMQLLDMNKIYYDAYVSRAYLMYRDKSHAEKIFRLYKEMFKDRNIIIVEGNYTRNGYNNDLFDGAKNIKRIICPDYNCFEVYDKIYNAIIETAKLEDLILITLGPTATVLAYDLACKGFQAIDLGQLDNEYEWYLRKSQMMEAIPGKTVSDLKTDSHLDKIAIDNEYNSQIFIKLEK